MKFNGTTWVNAGNAGFSEGIAYFTSLAFSPANGQPYVAFAAGKATVMKFDGTNWVVVGTAGFSSYGAYATNFAFRLSGQPYVAF